MDYLDMINKIPAYKIALIEGSASYTYGDIAAQARHLRQSPSNMLSSPIILIKDSTTYRQLVSFIAYSGSSHIPVIIPSDLKQAPQISKDTAIPSAACMGVLTSGTTGAPSIWFRSFESWHSFFSVQNTIFGIDSSTKMFIHGSLAFTGNLNMCLALLWSGACIVTHVPLYPPLWNQIIAKTHVNAIYMIPSKLRLLARTAKHPISQIKTIITGSQNLGEKDADSLKLAYPQSRCLLYYGASELSYVSYLTDREMYGNPACVGKPFPGIHVEIMNGEIYVHTPYAALGAAQPCSAGDLGYIDKHGRIFLKGRKDDIYNIHGRKISAVKIENALLSISHVKDAAVILENNTITAYVSLSIDQLRDSPAAAVTQLLIGQLRQTLEAHEIPRRFIYLKNLPKNSSGKTAKALLTMSQHDHAFPRVRYLKMIAAPGLGRTYHIALKTPRLRQWPTLA